MLPSAYLQSLDTVLYDPEKHRGGDLRNFLDQSFAKTMIYSVFYEIMLSPNQVLDLSLLRQPNLDPSIDPASYPFVLSVGSNFVEQPNPFVSHLVSMLRRGGKDAFIFSSLRNNRLLAMSWGEFIESDGKNMSDNELLVEATKTPYAEIVEWAEKLDTESNHLAIHPYWGSQGIKFLDTFRSFLDETQHLGWLPSLPSSRSESYQLIEAAIEDKRLQAIARQIPDFVSNAQYASGVNSRLSIESSSILDVDPTSSTMLRVDFNGIFSKYESTLEALVETSYRELSAARIKARESMLKGWDMKDNNQKEAERLFGKGLRTFLGKVVELKRTETLISVGLPAPVTAVVNVPASLVAKWKLRGIDKFINFT